MSFDWAYATSSVQNFLSSGYFFAIILLIAGCSILSKLLKLLWLVTVLFLIWALAQAGAFDVVAGWLGSL